MVTSLTYANRWLLIALVLYVGGGLLAAAVSFVHPVFGVVVGILVGVLLIYALFAAVDRLIIERIKEYDRFDRIEAGGE